MVKIHQRGVQWKQGVVIYMMLCTSLLYYTTPIHCTALRLHPPWMNTQVGGPWAAGATPGGATLPVRASADADAAVVRLLYAGETFRATERRLGADRRLFLETIPLQLHSSDACLRNR